jgi:hypothetical protein
MHRRGRFVGRNPMPELLIAEIGAGRDDFAKIAKLCTTAPAGDRTAFGEIVAGKGSSADGGRRPRTQTGGKSGSTWANRQRRRCTDHVPGFDDVDYGSRQRLLGQKLTHEAAVVAVLGRNRTRRRRQSRLFRTLGVLRAMLVKGGIVRAGMSTPTSIPGRFAPRGGANGRRVVNMAMVVK